MSYFLIANQYNSFTSSSPQTKIPGSTSVTNPQGNKSTK